MSRFAKILFAIIVGLALAAPSAAAVPTNKAPSYLAAVWTTVFETPSDQNPFGAGGSGYGCLNLGGTVAPFGPAGVASCTVKPGTRLFVIASSVECSTIEGNGTTEGELRACAEASDASTAPALTLDGKALTPVAVETPLVDVVLGHDNIFAAPAGTTGELVGHGWVVLLHPLTPGTHAIVIGVGAAAITTLIYVVPGA